MVLRDASASKKVMAVSEELFEAVCSQQRLKTLRIKNAGSLAEINKRNYLNTWYFFKATKFIDCIDMF